MEFVTMKKPTYQELEQQVRELKQADIECKAVKEALSASEEKINAVFNNSLDAIIIVNAQSFRIIGVNQTSLKMIGYDQNDLIGEPFSILFPPESELSDKELLEKIKIYGPVLTQEFRLADGRICPMDLTVTPVTWGREKAFLATFRDIEDRLKAEEERERIIADLQDALSKIKTLSGLLPICANCKKIRDDKGYWNKIEIYIRDQSNADFTHSICPECAKKLYSDIGHNP